MSDPVEDDTAATDPILDDTSLPVQDVLEEGFCYDDIYATYLRESYIKEKSPVLRKYKSRRSRNARRKTINNESLFFARSELRGPMSPYFGSIPVVANHKVEFWMRYFKTMGRRTFMKWLVRAESFKKVVTPVLVKEGMPPEFVYLAMVESGFNNRAYSHKSATGAWQFMGPTARSYKLKIDHWVDERRDPIKSTVAAANYLRDLYGRFGDWYLAMAAYNAGPGKVRSAIRRSKSRDFWKISQTRYLRNETKHYVPKVLAALNLASNLKEHGFNVKPNPADITPESSVTLVRPLRINEIARKMNIPSKAIKRWNPEIIRGVTPPISRRRKSYALRMPSELIARFNAVESSLSKIAITDVLMYKVRSGDTLSQIARRHKVRISQIKAINPKLRPRTLRIGKKIAIPIPGIVVEKSTTSG